MNGSTKLDWLTEPAEPTGHPDVNRAIWSLWESRADLREAFADPTGADAERLLEWARCYGAAAGLPPRLVPPPPQWAQSGRSEHPVGGLDPMPATLEDGVNVIGFLRASLGTSEAARLAIAALDEVRVPALPLDVAEHMVEHRVGRGEFTPAPKGTPPAYRQNLICINGPELVPATRELGPDLFTARRSIGFWWWETEGALPHTWSDALYYLNEIWVGSRHVADALRPHTSLPISQVRLPVVPPAHGSLDRDALGLPEGFLFLTMLDYYSVLERKNPVASIDAFRRAFAPHSGAKLVIKTTNAHHDPVAHAGLIKAAAEHPDIFVFDRFLPRPAHGSLLASCDCVVSLHRAEGFGLPLAEAMALGTPAIATGYSGNLDFMTEHNSELVQYRLEPIGSDRQFYPAKGRWAEPDVDQAAAAMRRLFTGERDPRSLGRKAASDLRRTHSLKAAGECMKARLETSSTAQPRPAAQPAEFQPPEPQRRWPRRALRSGALRLVRPYSAYQTDVNQDLRELVAQTATQTAREKARHAAEVAELLATARRHARQAELLEQTVVYSTG